MINGENLHIALTWASKGTQKRGRAHNGNRTFRWMGDPGQMPPPLPRIGMHGRFLYPTPYPKQGKGENDEFKSHNHDLT